MTTTKPLSRPLHEIRPEFFTEKPGFSPPSAPIYEFLRIVFEQQAKGEIIFNSDIRPGDHNNENDISMSTRIINTLMDSAPGASFLSVLNKEQVPSTQDMTLQFYRSVNNLSGLVIAKGSVKKLIKDEAGNIDSGTARATLLDEQGVEYISAISRLKALDMPSGNGAHAYDAFAGISHDPLKTTVAEMSSDGSRIDMLPVPYTDNNHMGGVHGGTIMAMAHHAAEYALRTRLQQDGRNIEFFPYSFNLNFFRAIGTEPIHTHADIPKIGRGFSSVGVKIIKDDGNKELARGVMTFAFEPGQ